MFSKSFADLIESITTFQNVHVKAHKCVVCFKYYTDAAYDYK